MSPSTIWCVGRNYAKHAKEMNAEIPKSPLIFIKSGGCLKETNFISLPSFSQDIHHELEIALLLGDSLEVSSIALALDLTARDIQTELKKKGLPWALAKSFKESCPTSQWVPYQGEGWFKTLSFDLKVNGTIRQLGKTKDMIFQPAELIKYLKSLYPILPGDIILSGTPEGVAPLKPGDALDAQINGLLSWKSLIKN